MQFVNRLLDGLQYIRYEFLWTNSLRSWPWAGGNWADTNSSPFYGPFRGSFYAWSEKKRQCACGTPCFWNGTTRTYTATSSKNLSSITCNIISCRIIRSTLAARSDQSYGTVFATASFLSLASLNYTLDLGKPRCPAIIDIVITLANCWWLFWSPPPWVG